MLPERYNNKVLQLAMTDSVKSRPVNLTWEENGLN